MGLLSAAATSAQPPAAERNGRAGDSIQIPPSANADPVADAKSAAESDKFGLIVGGGWFTSAPVGVVCLTPYGQAPSVLASVAYGDVVTRTVTAAQVYAAAYNRTLVDQPTYPDGDLCRIATAADTNRLRTGTDLGSPARPVEQPSHDLHEAARRGTVSEISRFLKTSSVDSLDSFGMTPLAWATARANSPAIEFLVSNRADPWIGEHGARGGAVYWAAALGRFEIFERLAMLSRKPFEAWPQHFVRAAVLSGNTDILRRILAEPHEPYQGVNDFPPLQTMALVLDDAPTTLANELLIKSLNWTGEDHLALAKLALVKGADPNATGSGWPTGTALGIAASGISASSLQAVQILLTAGAHVNLMSGDRRPIWCAAQTLMLSQDWNEVDDRAQAIFLELARRGADLKLTNADGKPPIWSMLFPLKYAPDKLDPLFITPKLLAMFVANGMDINARWNGKLVLPAVERQAGTGSALATALRDNGAHD